MREIKFSHHPQGQGPLPGEVFCLVHELAATIVAVPGIALGVLVRQHAAYRFKNRLGNEILRSDQLNVFLLTLLFQLDNLSNFTVNFFNRLVIHYAPSFSFSSCDILSRRL